MPTSWVSSPGMLGRLGHRMRHHPDAADKPKEPSSRAVDMMRSSAFLDKAMGRARLLHYLPAKLVLVAAIVALGASACGSSTPNSGSGDAGSKSITKVNIAIPEPGADFVPLVVAQHKGFFKKLGVSVNLTTVSTPDQIAAVESGSVDFMTVAAYAIQATWTKHLDLRLVSGIVLSPPYSLLVKPSIKSLSQLKGKSIGTNGSSDFLAQLTAYYLQKQAGIPEKDVTYVGLGPDPKRLAGLEAGSVDAATFDPGFPPMAEARGFKDILDFSSVAKDTPVSGLISTTSFIKSNMATVKAVVTGMHEGMAWLKSHKSAGIAQYQSYLGETSTEAAATYAASIQGYNYSGAVTPAEIGKDLAISSAFSSARTGTSISIPNPFTAADAAQVAQIIK